MRTFNVDEFLKENEITITIGGKNFVVKDIPDDLQAILKDDEQGQTEAIKKILNCTNEDLAGYGLAAKGAIIRNVSENFFQKPFQENQ